MMTQANNTKSAFVTIVLVVIACAIYLGLCKMLGWTPSTMPAIVACVIAIVAAVILDRTVFRS